MPQPSQLSLEEQVFSQSYSSFLKELSVWYFLPPSDAEDALQTADVKCLEGLDMLSIEGPCLTTCLLYTSPSPRDRTRSRMPSSA